MATWTWVIIGLGALCVVGVIIACVIVVRRRKEAQRIADSIAKLRSFPISSYNTPPPFTQECRRSEIRSSGR